MENNAICECITERNQIQQAKQKVASDNYMHLQKCMYLQKYMHLQKCMIYYPCRTDLFFIFHRLKIRKIPYYKPERQTPHEQRKI